MTQGKTSRRIPQPPEVPGEEEMDAAAAKILESLHSSPEVAGVRAPEEQQAEQVRLQSAPVGNSRGVASADRDVPAGAPPTPPNHVVKDGAAEDAAGTRGGYGGENKPASRKAKGLKKGGSKAAAAGMSAATRNRRRKHGPAHLPGLHQRDIDTQRSIPPLGQQVRQKGNETGP
ncbi:UNVERIFIED_CONTAM: hypothetical protein K2H54_049619 [Gekko kuhli]